jgi:hypothetical protein
MSRSNDSSELDMRALLEQGNRVPRQPESVRERVLARARATAAAPLAPLPPGQAQRTPFPRQLVTPAAALAVAGGIAATAYSLGGTWSGSAGHSSPMTSSRSVPAQVAVAATAAAPPGPTAAPPAAGPSAVPKAQPRTAPAGRPQASYEAELGLIRSAHTAYASHDFANALVLVGEHAQRFPRGLLAEEREALRIRSLLGTGRRKDAERAASAFASRFPRSVLLPRLRAELGTAFD